MKSKVKRLIIIPAKGKSSRVKNKNMKLFFGRRIIDYSIIAAKKSKLFKEIHVSTESNLIKNHCLKVGAKVPFLRKKNLSGSKTPLFDVYKFTVDNYKKLNQFFDEIWCLLPCSPLITSNDLVVLSKKILHKKVKLPCISVAKFPAPIEWSYTISRKKKLTPVFNKKHIIQSQAFKSKFYDVGVLSVFKYENFIKNSSVSINKKLYGHELHWSKSVDIDNLDDWQEAKEKYLIRNFI